MTQSKLGEGSTFQIYLPKVSERAEVAPRAETASELPGGSERILVVEDDEALRELTVEALRGLGYQVLEASDGEEAQRLLMADESAPIDLVLTDVGMPRLDGASLAKWAAIEKPAAKVLLVSGYATDRRMDQVNLAVDYRFLPKPFTRKQLAVSVRKALDHPSAPIS